MARSRRRRLMTREEVLDVGLLMAEKLGYVPPRPVRALARLAREFWGSWKDFAAEVALDSGRPIEEGTPPGRSTKWPAPRLLEAAVKRLRAWMASARGGILSLGRLPPAHAVQARFGGRAGLLRAASRALGFRSFDDLCRARFARLLRNSGGLAARLRTGRAPRRRRRPARRPPPQVEFVRRFRVSYPTIRRLFGSWSRFTRAALRS